MLNPATGLPSRAVAQPHGALLWSDEFDGPVGTAPNASNWLLETGRGWGGASGTYYTASNSQLDGNSNMAIQVRNETTPDAHVPPDTQAFTSAWFQSVPVFGGSAYPLPLKIVYKAIVPYTYGIWPGLWLSGEESTALNPATWAAYVAWPAKGELDIVETDLGGTNNREGHIHMGTVGNLSTDRSWTSYTAPHDSDWHIFGLDWYADHLNYHVDGVLAGGLTSAQAAAGSADWTCYAGNWGFHLMMNVAVGGPGSATPSAVSVWPQTMLVDYVRVYAL